MMAFQPFAVYKALAASKNVGFSGVPSRGFKEFLRRVQQADAAKTAVVDSRGSISYGELLSASKSLSAVISANGSRTTAAEQERFAIFTPRDRDYLISKLAIWQANGISVPLNDGSPPQDLAYYLETTTPTSLLASGDGKHKAVAEELSQLTRTPIQWVPQQHQPAGAAVGGVVKADESDDESQAALMVFTSGTTSKPKGCVTSKRALKAQVDALVTAWEFSPSDRLYYILPTHHVHGILALLCTLSVGGTAEMAPKFDPQATWEAIARPKSSGNGITVITAVPTVYAKLIQHYDAQPKDIQRRWSDTLKTNSACRLMISGSAALPQSVAKRWKEITGHTLLERMGSTEVGLALSNPYRGGERVLNSVGVPLPGYEARLVDVDAGNDIKVIDGAGKSGELQFRGAGLFTGYYKRPDATAECMTSDGFYKTGDSAHRDEKGYYYIDGRLSADIMKSSGFKLSALEIERHLLEDKGNRLAEVAVFGIPDETVGEKVVAIAVASDGALPADPAAVVAANSDSSRLALIRSPEAEALASSVRADAKHHMAAYKVPSTIAFVHAIPRNAMGKVNKKELKKLYLAAVAGK